MLTPEQLANCADDIVELYAKLDEEIIRDVVRRFCQTGIITETGKLQLNGLQNVGMLHSDIMRSFSEYSGISQEMTRKLFEQAAVTSLEYDMAIYLENGLEPVPLYMSPAAMQVLEAGYIKTEGNLQNLTMTTAKTSQTNFISACTLAEMKVESGAFSYNQAILDAIKLLAVEGSSVSYPSGHTDKLDVAVRRNVMTGLGQTTGQICLGYAQELGCDLMEITAHSGARPSHAAWQGRIVSLSGRKGYLTLTDIGYGTGEGFKGWNCRHDWYPYFEGSTRMYSDEDLEALNAKDVEYPDGSMHTQYEAEQRQRAYERKIRQYKRELAADDEAIKTLKDEVAIKTAKDDFDKVSVKLKSVEAELQAFCEKTDLLPANARTQVYSFGRSTAQRAVQRNKRINEIAEMYKVDFGKMSNLDIFKLDKQALKVKRNYFTSDYKNSGNFAIMQYGGEYYYAHSQANIVNGVENVAFSKYKGDKTHLARTEVEENKRIFETFNVAQSSGKKITSDSETVRYQTYEDTEAKLFESLETLWYNGRNKKINILSERGMCDSCKYVAEQFIKKHPEAKVNIVSGVQATGNPWKGRKPYD